MGCEVGIGWEVLVRTPSPEGLLNGLAGAEIVFSGTEIIDGATLYLRVSYREIKQLRRVAEAYGSEVVLSRPVGLQLKLHRLKKRYALLVTLGICMMLLAVSNLFVWRIEVHGNEQVPTGAICRAVSKAGGGIGSFWPMFDGEKMRTEILLALDDLQWATVNYRGGAIEVLVREKKEVPKVVDNDAPYHIIAEKAGVLTELSVKQGQPHAAVGDTVEKGQVLVSGAAVSSIGTTRSVHALGNAKARTWYTITAKQPAVVTEKVYNGKKKVKLALILGTNRINFYSKSSIFEDSCDTITMDYHLCMDDVFSLPVRLLVQRCVYRTVQEREMNPQAREETAQNALMEVLEQRMREDGKVIAAEFAAMPREGGMIVTLKAECAEEIGEEIPMSEEELRQIQLEHSLREEATND